jgi:hypothetical protein
VGILGHSLKYIYLTNRNTLKLLSLLLDDLFRVMLNKQIYTGLHGAMSHKRSRYGNWLRAGGPRGQSLSPGRVKHFLFST